MEFFANGIEFAESEHTILISAKFPIRRFIRGGLKVKMKNLDFFQYAEIPSRRAVDELRMAQLWRLRCSHVAAQHKRSACMAVVQPASRHGICGLCGCLYVPGVPQAVRARNEHGGR